MINSVVVVKHPNDLMKIIRQNDPSAETDLVIKAFEFLSDPMYCSRSDISFQKQILELAALAASIGMDVPSICAAILSFSSAHSHEVIKNRFSSEIYNLVTDVQKFGGLELDHYALSKNDEVEAIRRSLITSYKDVRALYIIIFRSLQVAHSLHANLISGSQIDIAKGILQIYAPLARQLGIAWVGDKLENLAFKYINSQAYNSINTQLINWEKSTSKEFRLLSNDMSELARKSGFNIYIHELHRSPFVIWRRLQQSKASTISSINCFGYAIIVNNAADAYKFLEALENEYELKLKNGIDANFPRVHDEYFALHTPLIKIGGYQVAIQVRTIRADKFLNNGIFSQNFNRQDMHKLLSKFDRINFLSNLDLALLDIDRCRKHGFRQIDRFNLSQQEIATLSNPIVLKTPETIPQIDVNWRRELSMFFENEGISDQILTDEFFTRFSLSISSVIDDRYPAINILKIVETPLEREVSQMVERALSGLPPKYPYHPQKWSHEEDGLTGIALFLMEHYGKYLTSFGARRDAIFLDELRIIHPSEGKLIELSEKLKSPKLKTVYGSSGWGNDVAKSLNSKKPNIANLVMSGRERNKKIIRSLLGETDERTLNVLKAANSIFRALPK